MPRISEMPSPDLPLTGLELIPVLQGVGLPGNRGLPLLTHNPAFGGAVLAMRLPMVADLSATTEADPGAGNIRWSNADPHAATELYVSDADGDAGDLAAVLASLDVGGFVYVQGGPALARDNRQRWQVTDKTAGTGYTTLEVTLQASAGTFTDADELEFTVQQPAPSPGVDRNVVTTVSSSSGTLTLDASLGDYFKTTLAEAVDTLSITNAPTACTLGIWITQAAGQYAFDFPASLDWGAGNSAPAVDELAAGAVLFVVISTYNAGGKWDASARVRG